jgi:hypothetical protein
MGKGHYLEGFKGNSYAKKGFRYRGKKREFFGGFGILGETVHQDKIV